MELHYAVPIDLDKIYEFRVKYKDKKLKESEILDFYIKDCDYENVIAKAYKIVAKMENKKQRKYKLDILDLYLVLLNKDIITWDDESTYLYRNATLEVGKIVKRAISEVDTSKEEKVDEFVLKKINVLSETNSLLNAIRSVRKPESIEPAHPENFIE